VMLHHAGGAQRRASLITVLPPQFPLAGFFNLASGGGSRACGPVRWTTVRLCFAEKSLSGRFALAHFARLGEVTAF